MSTTHNYALKLRWTGAAKGPTENYARFSREYRIDIPGKPPITGSADPTFHGDPALANPEDLLLAALSACHMLSYLAVCALGKIKVISYEDSASGTLAEIAPQRSAFTEATLTSEKAPLGRATPWICHRPGVGAGAGAFLRLGTGPCAVVS